MGLTDERPENTPVDVQPELTAPETSELPLFEGRYRLGPVLGRGGTCSVYRAWDLQLQRYVAIKRLEPPLSEDEHLRARFHREGRAIGRLSHPHVVTLLDHGSTPTDEYLVFEYVEGRSLKDLITADGPLAPERAGQIAGQIAEGLAHVHLAGLVHRDVKPQNILLDSEDRACLTDFGIATGPEWTRVTRAGAIVGTSRYMSPEQIQNRPVDARSDIYSLGLVLYEMLAGRPAFDGSNIAEIGRKHLKERPEALGSLRNDLPPSLERVVMHCIEKLPESRFQSMEQLLGALVGLGLYEPRRGTDGLLDFLRRGREDSLSDNAGWTPPPDTMIAPPPGQRRASVMRGRRARSRKNIWVYALGAVVLLAALAVGLSLLFSGPTLAPSVVGMSLEEARDAAQRAGLRVDITETPVPDQPEGTVIEQSPAQGEEVANKTLRLVVTSAPAAIQITRIIDVDPEGDDAENPDLLPLIYDGDETTAWVSEPYGSSDFNGVKSGVGISFELEKEATMLRIVTSDTRWLGKLMVPNEANTALMETADLGGSLTQVIKLQDPIRTGRLWFTKLGRDDQGSFRVQLLEVEFYE